MSKTLCRIYMDLSSLNHKQTLFTEKFYVLMKRKQHSCNETLSVPLDKSNNNLGAGSDHGCTPCWWERSYNLNIAFSWLIIS